MSLNGVRLMRQSLLPIALSAILLSACTGDRGVPASVETDATAPATASPDDALPPAMPQPEPGEAGDASAPDASTRGDAQASFSAFGDVKLGIAATDMQAAWGGELKDVGKDFNQTCYFMTPAWVKAPAEFAFMIEDGKFVRYGTESVKFIAPGGGRIGMTAADIASLYPGRIEEQPHKYTDGKYLRIKDTSSENALLFETDATGKVTEWRVGMPPQVDYVEGCS